MWVALERRILQLRSRFLRFHSVNVENVEINRNVLGYADNYDTIIDQSWNVESIRSDDKKLLRIAMLGLPNVGKSTLVNSLVGRPVCGTSSKVQTTKVKSDAVYVEGDTQLIFVDTPGLVTNSEVKKYKLDKSFKTDVDLALQKADIVGVIQDASHRFEATVIDERLLAVLERLKPEIPTLLILNKIDKVKEKRKLLEMVDILTGVKGWQNFSDIFMISALKSDGVDDLRRYLIDSSKLRDWEYDGDAISNESSAKIIEDAVRAKFMDHLPQELPYVIQAATEHIGELSDGSMSVVVSVTCPSDRISSIVMGKGGARVKTVALLTEQELCQIFRTTVRLKIAIKFTQPKIETVHTKKKGRIR